MHPVLMTIVALGINSGDGHVQAPKAPAPYVQNVGCASCGTAGCGHGSHRDVKKALHAAHNMMPQTCYEPTFGCYRGSRFMNRYPAFHGTYYRRPYNYRNVFDYPWHAELHEPTSLFSYNVAGPDAQPQMQMRTQSTEEIQPTGEAPAERPAEQPTASTLLRSRNLPSTTEPIGTGVRSSRNPFRSASIESTNDSSNRASSTSSRRTHRRASITTPRISR